MATASTALNMCHKCNTDVSLPLEERPSLVAIANCFHVFHTDCLNPWIDTNATCGVCRYQVEILESGKSFKAFCLVFNAALTIRTKKIHQVFNSLHEADTSCPICFLSYDAKDPLGKNPLLNNEEYPPLNIAYSSTEKRFRHLDCPKETLSSDCISLQAEKNLSSDWIPVQFAHLVQLTKKLCSEEPSLAQKFYPAPSFFKWTASHVNAFLKKMLR